jgi:phosphatidylcholine synthase
MNLGRLSLFSVHVLTASGAALSLLALMAITDREWTLPLSARIALLVDGVDGPIARRYRVRERLPDWDGAAMDNVIDYTSYVFAPAIIIAKAIGLSPLLGAVAGIIITVSGALYYADTRTKQPIIHSAASPSSGTWWPSVFTRFRRRRPSP